MGWPANSGRRLTAPEPALPPISFSIRPNPRLRALCYAERRAIGRAGSAPAERAMGSDKPHIRRFGWAGAAFATLVALARGVGARPRESGDVALQRLVMVLLA